MSGRTLAISAGLSLCTLLGVAVSAQQPRIVNGQVSNQSVDPGLAQTFRTLVDSSTDVVWVGYTVPVKDRDRTMCCWSNGNTSFSGSMASGDAPCCGSCRIEPDASRATREGAAQPPAGAVKLEGADRMLVLFRVANRQVERIRTFSEDCEIDAGGRPVRLIQQVSPADSVALLASLVSSEPVRKSRITNAAMAALAQHAEPAASTALARLAREHTAAAVRGEALFWMAQRGDESAAGEILRALDRDPDVQVRKRAVFALAQLRDEAGVEPLIRTSRTHADATVRGEAIFWLGQKAGRKAAATITDAIEKDPETDVKRRAVFALSQLPKDEGVPLLIDVARKNANPAVRKQAIFWLSQSKDPRAIDFFAEILK